MKKHIIIILAFSLLILKSSVAQPPCGTNSTAGDYCSTATPICDLNGYCGITDSTYTAFVSATDQTDEDNSPLGSIFCGSIENNSWLKFTAAAASATFNIWPANCSAGNGVQMEVYSSTDCYNFVSQSNCYNPGNDNPGTITATGLTVGNVYYIMIDGNAGDVCEYVIGAQSGVQFGATVSPDQSICPGNFAAIELTTSGVVPVTWTANPPDPSLAGQQNNSSISVSPTATTVYSVNVNDSIGFCIVDTTLTTTVTVLPPTDPLCGAVISCTISKTDATTCPVPPTNTCNGVATINAVGGAGTYSYLWSNGNTNVSQNDFCAGTYTVTVSDPGGVFSPSTCSVTILGPEPPEFALTPTHTCEDADDGAVDLTIISGTPPYTYLWSNSATSQNISGLAAGSYSVTVSDNSLCPADTTITVNSIPNPVATIIASPLVAYPNEPVTFTGTSGSNINYWNWNFDYPTGIYEPTITNTTTHTYGSVGAYNVYLMVQNDFGCSDTTTIHIDVIDIIIPNVFTPDGDGINEVFEITNIDKLKNTNVSIYNRWGNKVLDANDYKNDWDGGDCSEGTYYYIISLGGENTFNGTVNILKK